jgi:putative endonuclease
MRLGGFMFAGYNIKVLTVKKTIGNFGEQLACDFLIRRGYQIIDRNKKIGRREIDIIAADYGVLVFVEVKTTARIINAAAEEALSRGQIETIKKAISLYCRAKRIDLNKTRLDFICIKINRFSQKAVLKHYRNIY